MIHWALKLVGGLLLVALSHVPTAAQQAVRPLEVERPFDRVIVVEMRGEQAIDDWLFEAWRTEIERAAKMPEGRTAIVLMIHSGGGSVIAARQIVELVQQHSENESLSVFAFIDKKALSAAAWVAMATRGIFITADALFGDIQPIVLDYRGYENVPEKIVTALAEEVWLTCKRNGVAPTYPRLFVEAMVDKDIEIVAVENAKLGTRSFMRAADFDALSAAERDRLSRRSLGTPGKALTTNGQDLLEFGFAVRVVKDRFSLSDILGAPKSEIELRRVERPSTWDVLLNWRWLLVVAGFVFLVLELKTPGLGIMGVLSVLCFLSFFLLQSGWTDRALVSTGLFLVGMFLIVMEVMILPGFFFPGVAGFFLILYSTWVAISDAPADTLLPLPSLGDDDGSTQFRQWAMMITGSLVGGLVIALSFGRFLHRIPFLSRMILGSSGRTGMAPQTHAAASMPPPVSVGDVGVTTTDLHPIGVARFAHRHVDVISQGGWITGGRRVEIVEIAGNRVVVRDIGEAGPSS